MLKDTIISWFNHKKGQSDSLSEKPLYQSYKVYDHLWAGEYPRDKNEELATDKIQQML